jgi:deazaflavin-dependent oxidoreductase (nitroreductase family)
MGARQRISGLIEGTVARTDRVGLIEVRGRRAGRQIRTPVGYVQREDGSIVVGGGAATAYWPRSLLSDPRCRLSVRGAEITCSATELHGAERAAAVADIRARYGVPAAGAGAGPVFRLEPADRSPAGISIAPRPSSRSSL